MNENMLNNWELFFYNVIFSILHSIFYTVFSVIENGITMYDKEINIIINNNLFFLVFCFCIIQALLNLSAKYFKIDEVMGVFVFVGFCFLLFIFYILNFLFFLIFYNYA